MAKIIRSDISPCASSSGYHTEDLVCHIVLPYITPNVLQISRNSKIPANVQNPDNIMIAILKVHLEVIRLTRLSTNERSALIGAGDFEPAWEDEPAYNWDILDGNVSWAVPASFDLLGEWLWNGCRFTG